MKELLRHQTTSGISYRTLYDQAVESFKSTGTPETLVNGTTISGPCTIPYIDAQGNRVDITAECGPLYPDNPTGPVQSITIPQGHGFEQQWGAPTYQQQSLENRQSYSGSLEDQLVEAGGELLGTGLIVGGVIGFVWGVGKVVDGIRSNR